MSIKRQEEESKDEEEVQETPLDISLPFYEIPSNNPYPPLSQEQLEQLSDSKNNGNYYDQFYGVWARNNWNDRQFHNQQQQQPHTLVMTQQRHNIIPSLNLGPSSLCPGTPPAAPPPPPLMQNLIPRPPIPLSSLPQMQMPRPPSLLQDPYDHPRSRYNDSSNRY